MEISNNQATEAYKSRTEQRQLALMTATMNFVGYFMGLSDSQEVAESKVSQISTEVASLLYVYTLGNQQPLIDAINNISEIIYPFMNAEAKAALIANLTPPV